MTQLIRHRGPDDEGYILFKEDSQPPIILGGCDTPSEVYKSPLPYCPKKQVQEQKEIPCIASLGHRRLSIVDLSPAGHQPMASEDQTLWITYNGEIYNYIEVRQELISKGHNFQTQSDTEVILKAYQEWGSDCLQSFNGMFAFIIYDHARKRVFTARDRFGVKPLYYWISPQGSIAFASEIKQFSALPGWSPHINGQKVYDFLNWGVLNHTEETLFHGVRQLRGGECLDFDLTPSGTSNFKPRQWYRLSPKPFKGSFEQAAHEYKDLLQNSIKLRLRADVDIGSCLSGGLDSSAIVCLSNQLLRNQEANGRQKTFSACSEVKRFDERSFIDMIVNHTDVKSHHVYPSIDSLFEESRSITWHQDEPFISTSIYAQWLVFKLVKENHVKVILDGQGADELLAGYHGFFGNRFYGLLRSLQLMKLFQEIATTKRLHKGTKPWPLILNKLMPDLIRQPIRKILGKSAANPAWLNVNLLNAHDRDPFHKHKHNLLQDQSRHQLLHSSLPMLLHFEDRNSMAHSIESRTPFLDYRLVEFTLGLPDEYKIKNGWTKRVLRESMKGILPEPIRSRIDKLGFVTAEEDWVKRHHSQFLQSVDDSIDISNGILRPSVKGLASDIISGKRPFSYLLWRLISFGQWAKTFSVKVN